MANRLPYLVSALVLSLSACGSRVPADQLIRSADPYARGYTDDDFPRIRELAAGVFSYEQLRSAGAEKFTTVSLFRRYRRRCPRRGRAGQHRGDPPPGRAHRRGHRRADPHGRDRFRPR